jgi:hypothetical protein
MRSDSTTPWLPQSEIEAAEHLFDNWFDPIEAELRDRARKLLQAMLEAELHSAARDAAFWPSAWTPITNISEIAVALWSSRTRTTVPSRMSCTICQRAAESPQFWACKIPQFGGVVISRWCDRHLHFWVGDRAAWAAA